MLPAPTVTGYQGFWYLHAPIGQGGAYNLYGNRYAVEQKIAHAFGRRGFKQTRCLMYALLGAGTGGAASETETRVSAPNALTSSQQLGGLRTMETVTIVNRNTTAADLTYMQNMLNRVYNSAPAIASYPVDLSGNGGGGKVAR